MRHVRFAAMAEGFLRDTVRAWPALDSKEAKDMLFTSVLPLVGGAKVVPPDLRCGRPRRERRHQQHGAVRPAGRLVDAAGRHGGPTFRARLRCSQ